jgi:hypothetical protein
LELQFSEAVEGVDAAEFELDGAILSNPGGPGDLWSFDISPPVFDDATPMLSYTGTGTVDASPNHNPLSAFSGFAVTNTSTVAAPTPAPSLSAVNGNAQATLTATAAEEGDTAEIKFFQGGQLIHEAACAPGEAIIYVVTGLTNGQSYAFTATAVDADGNESVASNSVTAVPDGPIPVPEGFVRVKWDYGFKGVPPTGPATFLFRVESHTPKRPVWIGHEMQNIHDAAQVATVDNGTGSIELPWNVEGGIWACTSPNGEQFGVYLKPEHDQTEVWLKNVSDG